MRGPRQGRLVTARAMVWSTIDIWLEQQGDRRVLLLFENAEDAVRHDNATRQVHLAAPIDLLQGLVSCEALAQRH